MVQHPHSQGRSYTRASVAGRYPYGKAMKDQLKDAVQRSFAKLMEEDAYLFECQREEELDYDERKLHEVCINHRLANHLEVEVIPIIRDKERMFVDIEFNRVGVSYKEVQINGRDKRVRPDIIIHNRKSGDQKRNCLVVECKKRGASQEDIDDDFGRIRALMEDGRYEYSFGLHVIYGRDGIQAVLFFKNDRGIQSESLNCS